MRARTGPAGEADALARAERVLVTRLRFLGDLVLTTPLLAALRRLRPDAHLAFLAESRYLDILRGHPGIDAFHELRRDAGTSMERARESWRLARELRRQRFDLVIDLFANPRSAWLARVTGAPVRVGRGNGWRRRLYTHEPRRTPEDRDAVAYHLASLRALGVPDPPRSAPALPLGGEERRRAARLLASLVPEPEAPLVGIHPGASWPGKRWTVEGFAAVARHLARERRAFLLVTHGPGEEETARAVLAAAGGRGALLGGAGWRELAAALSLCDLLLSNDAGPMHVSAAVGTTTVGIFGPSDPAMWFPYPSAEGHRAVDHRLACRPCSGKPCGARVCMAELAPATVIETLEEAWNAAGARARKGEARRALAGDGTGDGVAVREGTRAKI
jgi:lipopolysaccharide heptosyltransferase II